MAPQHETDSHGKSRQSVKVGSLGRRQLLHKVAKGGLGVVIAAALGKATTEEAAAYCTSQCKTVYTWSCRRKVCGDGRAVLNGYADVTYNYHHMIGGVCDYQLQCDSQTGYNVYRPDLCKIYSCNHVAS